MTRTLLTAIFLTVFSQTGWTRNFESGSGYTLKNVGPNRLSNFLNKQTWLDALWQEYTTSLSASALKKEADARGLRCGTKWGQAKVGKLSGDPQAPHLNI